MKIRNFTIAACALGLGALAGCGGGQTNAPANVAATPPAAPPVSESPSPSPSTRADSEQAVQPANEKLCKVDDLSIKLVDGDAAAGTVYRTLQFTNKGGRTCTIQGFPGVSYVGGQDHHQVGPAAFREEHKGEPIDLAPGQRAGADLGFVQVLNYEEATCKPQAVNGLRVYPPQETNSVIVPFEGTGCSSDQIPGNQLTVRSIEK